MRFINISEGLSLLNALPISDRHIGSSVPCPMESKNRSIDALSLISKATDLSKSEW